MTGKSFQNHYKIHSKFVPRDRTNSRKSTLNSLTNLQIRSIHSNSFLFLWTNCIRRLPSGKHYYNSFVPIRSNDFYIIFGNLLPWKFPSMETSSMETSSTETSSSRIILPAKLFFHGNFLPFSGGGGNISVFDTFCGILCRKRAKPRKPSRDGKLLPLKLFFQQNYSSMETSFQWLSKKWKKVSMEEWCCWKNTFHGRRFPSRGWFPRLCTVSA